MSDNTQIIDVAIQDGSSVILLTLPWPPQRADIAVVYAELKKLEHLNHGRVWEILDLCRSWGVPLPLWVYERLRVVLFEYFQLTPGALVSWKSFAIKKVRWAAVRHLKVHDNLTWEAAYCAAVKKLADTPAAGGEESMRKSYEEVQRSSKIALLQATDGSDGVDRHAREWFLQRNEFITAYYTSPALNWNEYGGTTECGWTEVRNASSG